MTVLRPQTSSPRQRGLVGWARLVEGAEDTSGWAGGCCFSLPPSRDPFKEFDVAACFSFLLAGLSFYEKIQTWDKRNTREKDTISTGCFQAPKLLTQIPLQNIRPSERCRTRQLKSLIRVQSHPLYSIVGDPLKHSHL